MVTHGAAQRDVPLETPRREVSFAGRLKAGERFSRLFGPDFLFTLRPEERSSPGPFGGWFIEVTRVGRVQNLADLTIPLRFGLRSVYLFAWHFRPNSNAQAKSGGSRSRQTSARRSRRRQSWVERELPTSRTVRWNSCIASDAAI
jgi:hypothetical protein